MSLLEGYFCNPRPTASQKIKFEFNASDFASRHMHDEEKPSGVAPNRRAQGEKSKRARGRFPKTPFLIQTFYPDSDFLQWVPRLDMVGPGYTQQRWLPKTGVTPSASRPWFFTWLPKMDLASIEDNELYKS